MHDDTSPSRPSDDATPLDEIPVGERETNLAPGTKRQVEEAGRDAA